MRFFFIITVIVFLCSLPIRLKTVGHLNGNDARINASGNLGVVGFSVSLQAKEGFRISILGKEIKLKKKENKKRSGGKSKSKTFPPISVLKPFIPKRIAVRGVVGVGEADKTALLIGASIIICDIINNTLNAIDVKNDENTIVLLPSYDKPVMDIEVGISLTINIMIILSTLFRILFSAIRRK